MSAFKTQLFPAVFLKASLHTKSCMCFGEIVHGNTWINRSGLCLKIQVQDLFQHLQCISFLPSPNTTEFSIAWKSKELTLEQEHQI